MAFKVIVAADLNGGIGCNGQLLFKLPLDMKRFKQITTDANGGGTNAVIMGRVTYESIGRPLPNRYNIVVSSKTPNVQSADPTDISSPYFVRSLDDALALSKRLKAYNVFVIGGAKLYAEALLHNDCREILLTVVDNTRDIRADVFFPQICEPWVMTSCTEPILDGGYSTRYQSYERRK